MIFGAVLRLLTLITVVLVSLLLQAQDGELDKSPPKDLSLPQLIDRFTAKESEWKRVRQNFTFRQSITVKVLDGNDDRGEYRQVADISYSGGQRVKNVVLAPQSGIDMSKEDLDDLESRSSFTIGREELTEYNVLYSGQQNIDQLHCYVFDVSPKTILKDHRYFQGSIWVDDRDFQIVRLRGKSVPDIRIKKKKKILENLFPQFTTWREQVDGKFWFPTFSSADDTLHFNAGEARIKQVLKFTDYKRASDALQSRN
jgi:hypothetical protein